MLLDSCAISSGIESHSGEAGYRIRTMFFRVAIIAHQVQHPPKSSSAVFHVFHRHMHIEASLAGPQFTQPLPPSGRIPHPAGLKAEGPFLGGRAYSQKQKKKKKATPPLVKGTLIICSQENFLQVQTTSPSTSGVPHAAALKKMTDAQA